MQLAGSASVDWDPTDAADLPGAQRAVRFRVDQVVQTEHASPLAWTAPVSSKHNPAAPDQASLARAALSLEITP